MKTYYIVKAYSANNRTKEERYNYFGKSEKLLGYILEEPYGIKRYTADEIRRYGFASIEGASRLANKFRSNQAFDGLTTIYTIIAETVPN